MDLCGEFREAGGKVAISLAVFRSEIAANVEAGIQFPKRKTKTITDGVFFGVLREEKSGDIEKFILTLESNRRSLAKLFPDPAWENVILHCVSMDDHVLNLPAQIAIPKQPTKSQQKAIFGNLSTEDGRKKYKKAIREIEHPAIEPVIHLNVLKFVGQVVDGLMEVIEGERVAALKRHNGETIEPTPLPVVPDRVDSLKKSLTEATCVDDRVKIVCGYIRLTGESDEHKIAVALGIKYKTLNRWKNDRPELRAEMESRGIVTAPRRLQGHFDKLGNLHAETSD
jgi:hypothetical protein